MSKTLRDSYIIFVNYTKIVLISVRSDTNLYLHLCLLWLSLKKKSIGQFCLFKYVCFYYLRHPPPFTIGWPKLMKHKKNIDELENCLELHFFLLLVILITKLAYLRRKLLKFFFKYWTFWAHVYGNIEISFQKYSI